MSNREKTCAAQRSCQEIQARKNNNPLIPTQHAQYVGGTGVLVPIGCQKFAVSDAGVPPVQKQPVQNTTVGIMNFQGSIPSSGTGITGNISESVANKSAIGGGNQKMHLSQSGVLYTLQMIREPVVEYQETRGVPRNEEITFVTLVTSLCTQAYTAAITILVMLWNLMPLVDGLVYFVRFFLDKLIDIVKTPDSKDKAIKGAILFGELTVITFIIFLIVGLIFMPVYVLMARLFSKVFSMIAW